jgi:hypothetical protein
VWPVIAFRADLKNNRAAPTIGVKVASSNREDFEMSIDGTQRRTSRSICSAVIAAAAVSLAEPTSATACTPDQEAQAHVAIVGREPGYALAALRACPDRYCPSFGRRLLIFEMTANVATVAAICPRELAAICAVEATTICALQTPLSGMVTADPASYPQESRTTKKSWAAVRTDRVVRG